jgi:hypothetical protein
MQPALSTTSLLTGFSFGQERLKRVPRLHSVLVAGVDIGQISSDERAYVIRDHLRNQLLAFSGRKCPPRPGTAKLTRRGGSRVG